MWQLFMQRSEQYQGRHLVQDAAILCKISLKVSVQDARILPSSVEDQCTYLHAPQLPHACICTHHSMPHCCMHGP